MSFQRLLRSLSTRHDSLSPGMIILGLRLTAVAVSVIVVAELWRLMAWLPWQVDCLIAAAAAIGFAYRFEREADR